MPQQPNIIFIFSDEWRAQATGYNGDPNAHTPVLDQLAAESTNLSLATSGCPVCCPYRGSLMTGQYPLTNGVFINDVELNPDCHSIAKAFNEGGYETGYIGKWHLYGSPEGQCERRKHRVPRSHQMGFDYWAGFECNHNYWDATYYVNNDPEPKKWEGYEPFAQSQMAVDYIQARQDQEQPYLLMLSWGPPHFPVHTAPDQYKAMYEDREIELHPNVPEAHREKAIEELRGYYAHIAALDEALKIVLDAIDEKDRNNTLLVYTSDHGDMSWSQGLPHKLYPFEESIRVPCLVRQPTSAGTVPSELPIPIDGPDMMPTLLGYAGLSIPDTVEGRDWSSQIKGKVELTGDESAYLNLTAASTWMRHYGIAPYRGLRSQRYTYVINHDGPWLLFDNETDPYQMQNLVNSSEHQDLRESLHLKLEQRMNELGDAFLTGETYLKRDGLSHYKEVTMPLKEQWVYPWETV